MRVLAFLALLIGLALIASGVWLLNSVEEIPTAAEAGIEDVKQAAIASCKCRREGGADDECDAIFDTARTAMLETAFGDGKHPQELGDATACAPISTSSECYEFADGVHCVATNYDVIANLGDIEISEVCTVEEARAIEMAERQGWLGPDGEGPSLNNEAEWAAANDRSSAAVQAMMRRILAGEPLPTDSPSDGCAG